MAEAKAGEARGMDTRQDEKDRGITIKSTAVSMMFELPKEAMVHIKQNVDDNQFLINLIDSPGKQNIR